ncbi:hypothetical protein [Streptomyces sp. NPDC059881]|uniref:hypothetical protein n=1 Tax=Streptomyces sp. NPDC059881 TaxID=3346986 RepID=UPI00365B846F
MAQSLFPDDLVQAQADWFRTYAALGAPGPRDTAALRRRLLRLSVRVLLHPFWSTGPGRSPAARVELRRQVCAHSERAVHGT